MLHRKSDRIWRHYLRVSKAMNDFDSNSVKYVAIQDFAFKLLKSYHEALLKEGVIKV